MVNEVTAHAGIETARHEASSVMERIIRFISLASLVSPLDVVPKLSNCIVI